jgi:hypothetical protein
MRGQFVALRFLSESRHMCFVGMDHPAVAVLRAFICERLQWEAASFKQSRALDKDKSVTMDDIQQAHQSFKNGLKDIYSKYCDVGLQAKRLRDQGVSFCDRPGDDPNYERISSVEEKRGKVYIVTRCDAENWWSRYEAVETSQGWKLRDRKGWKSKLDAKWLVEML